jgi:protein involved in polysaccharide export with SLBB domain
MSRRSFARAAAALAASTVMITFAAVLAAPQDRRAAKPPGPPPIERKDKEVDKRKPDRARSAQVTVAEAKAIIDRMIAEYDLKPRPEPSIPDDPPPHEGALIDIPVVAEPPDLLLVEVLETLPGRPISGERLIRPDGTITLGFYGEVYVRGLTLPQVKVAVIKHLRKFLSDVILGLITSEFEESPALVPRTVPIHGPADLNPLGEPENGKEESPPVKRRASIGPRDPRAPLRTPWTHARAVRAAWKRASAQVPQEKQAADKDQNAGVLAMPGSGQVKIIIEVRGEKTGIAAPNATDVNHNVPPEFAHGEPGPIRVVPPLESGAVFVDITAYNTKQYYVLGDVLIPGKLPITAHETVLDALQYAGGLIPTAEPKDIRLVRPGRNGKPAKVYKVDLEAIQEKGDVRTNYQLFAGDRLVVGRNEVVKRTVELDRLQAPIEAIVASIHRNVNMLRSIDELSPEQRDRVLNDLIDFWTKELSRKGDLKFDEQTLREVLRRQLKPAPPTARPGLPPGAR